MSRISQDMASKVAIKMTEKSYQKVTALHTSYKQLVTDIYKASIPKDVLSFYEKKKEYMRRTSSAKLNGHGFQHELVSMTEALPFDSSNDYNNYIEYTAAEAAKMTTAKRKWEKAQKELKELVSELEQALLALRTFSNIRKELPEAAPFLPPPMSNSLVVNFDSLHKRLKAQSALPEKQELVSTNQNQ